MKNFKQLTKSDGKPVWVNIGLVKDLTVTTIRGKTTTYVRFGKEDGVNVLEAPQQIDQ